MHDMKRWRIICYDVRDPKRYRKVYKIVRGVARRLQYSVFRAHLDDLAVQRVRYRLTSVMSPEDELLIIDLCPRCAAKVIAKNMVDSWSENLPEWEIVE